MSLRSKLRANGRNGAIGAGVTVLLGLLLLIPPKPGKPPLGSALIRLSFDFPFAWRSVQTNDEVRIVYMDEASHTMLGQSINGPWHRSLHAELLRELAARGARAVVFDVLFDSAWTKSAGTNLADLDQQLAEAVKANPELHVQMVKPEQVDQQFAKAIRAASNVVLAAKLDFDEDSRLGELKLPAWELGEKIHWGITELPIDPGLTPAIRMLQIYRPEYTNLAWEVAEVLGKAPPDRKQTRYLNYYGPRDTLPHVSFYRALQTDGVQANFFNGKVVFIGMGRLTTPRGKNTDDFATPYTRGTGETTQGVEIQATAFLNLWHRDWLTELSPLTELLLFIGLGVIFGFGFILVRPSTAVALAVLGFLSMGAGALLLVWHYRLWFPWLIAGAVQIPGALFWTFLWNTRNLYRDKEVLEKRLATAISNPSLPEAVAALRQPLLVSPIGSGSSAEGPTLIGPARADSGPQIPDHDLVRRVGQGAYGEVWLARDVIGSFHAVKIIYRKTFSSDGPFDREFKGIQKFTPISRSHPGFVNILHVGRNTPGGYFYYIMEAGDDETTGQKIVPDTYSPKNLAKEIEKRGFIPLRECLQLSLDLTSALEFLHQQQLIHRDLKPSNIIFVNGMSKIADIGLVTEISQRGRDVTYLGTEGYIPPEGPGSAAGDVFSLGKVIYEAALGRGASHFPELPTDLVKRPDHEELLELHQLTLRACATDVRIRYKGMAEWRADLLDLQKRLSLS